ncbi:hypothetical protein DICPUDRAFT_78776 [Dictyostelium purpureum]|uniref:Profilin n=1 Tax=Dictyostelium purpureum TaxID=5786 RepID=F0ZKJ0_DICPU|nr:uncharacterized protein DICPUDRAFT_78776 [Dictyostelium purpureum]EGC35549.1 hypothetical protein DICPUDRAFT_78776 [Dictyostelium purpureum]|eukprot:XP_003287920.1 hypothetical protein DICPUDRAFT_78776 [Dictyostelium purpureum]
MSLSSTLKKKSEYLESIGFLGITFIRNEKIIFSTISIKENEAIDLSRVVTKPKYSYQIDGNSYDFRHTDRCMVSKISTYRNLDVEYKNGCIFKIKNPTLEESVILLGMYSPLIETDQANEQLKSLFEYLQNKGFF